MGNQGKNNAKRRNKIAKASRSAWAIRKQQEVAVDDITAADSCEVNGEEIYLFQDIGDDSIVNDNEDYSSTLQSQTEDYREMENPEVEMEINSRPANWCLRVYPPATKNRNSESFRASGTISTPEYQKIMETHFETEKDSNNRSPVISGNRIVELGYVLEWAINLQYEHSKVCTSGKLYVHKEVTRNKGLSSSIIFKCSLCDAIIKHETENPEKVAEINRGAVWGTIATGSTFGHLEELLSCMNIPCMQDTMFYNIEKEVGAVWRNSMWSSMEAAGVRERNNALEKGQVCSDGTPWITVYVDGSWSKRSYGTNYNALSGMVGIIGRYTKEVLFIAVRNKFCCICAKGESKGRTPKEHMCHRNWNESASSMEADMAVEGFCRSEEMHKVRYLQFIADGDSSVFSKIKQKVPYGNDVRKIECTNHALKNYGKHLRKIKDDKTINLKGRKLLTLKKIQALTRRAKCSIYEHAKKENPNVQLLQQDLKLSLHHVFGEHSACREDICNDVGSNTNNEIPALKSTFIYNHLQGALNLLVRKSHLLITNENNNTAERLMNIVSRFTMGKRLNLIQRGSYERRVFLAGLRFNKAFKWHRSPWKKYTGNSPGDHFSSYMERQSLKMKAKSRKRLFEDGEARAQRSKRQKTFIEKNTDYGAGVDEPETAEDLKFILNEAKLIIERLQVTKEDVHRIQLESVGQFGNRVFEAERELRLTASLFGKVIHRRPHTPCHSLVKSCLSPSHFCTEATEYGIAKEGVAIQKFEEEYNLNVQPSGVWIDEEHGFLGASPDGLIGCDAIIEVKCIYAPDKLFNSIEELIPLLKNSFLTINDTGIVLKRQHNYYFQVQGQLNITKREKCYFVVYVNDRVPIHVEIIKRDEDFWVSKMLPKLCHFYEDCIAPEIVRGNLKKNKKCVDPPSIKAAITAYQQKQQTKTTGTKNSRSNNRTNSENYENLGIALLEPVD